MDGKLHDYYNEILSTRFTKIIRKIKLNQISTSKAYTSSRESSSTHNITKSVEMKVKQYNNLGHHIKINEFNKTRRVHEIHKSQSQTHEMQEDNNKKMF